MKKFTVLIVLFTFLQMLNSMESPPPSYYKSVKLSGQIQDQFEKKLKKIGLNFSAIGGSRDIDGTIKLVNFNVHRNAKPLSKEDARRLIIDCVESYLLIINNNEEIRPYLEQFPFTFKNFEFSIIGFNKDGSDIYYPNIAIIGSYGGKIFYETRDCENEFKDITLFTETYEEALQIVKNEKSENRK